MNFSEKVDKVADATDRPLWYVCWVILTGATLLSFAVVIMRYVFNLGYIWLDEICRYSFIAIVYLWAGPIARIGGHIRLEVLTARLTKRGLAIHSLVVNACVFVVCVLIVYWGTTLIQLSIMLDEKSESFVFSIWCLHSLVALGMSIYAFYSLLGVLKALAQLFEKEEITSSASVG